MKRIIAAFCTFLLTVALFGFNAFAADNHVKSIKVDAVLDTSDGSAKITQVWQGDFTDGTEVYYPFRLGDDLEISGFTVSDQKGKYKTLDEWDVDKSFKSKARTCGINEVDDENCEICWGISQYGSNTYTVTYTVKGIVGAYEDNDGFLFRFINSEMNTVPTSCDVTIRLKNGESIDSSCCKIWGFGYDGDIVFENGTVHAYTETDIYEDNYMTLLLGFNKGVFSKAVREGEGTFAELKERAFDGSEYEDDSAELYIILAIVGIVVAILAAVIIRVIYLKIKLKRFAENVDYYREAPCDGDLNAVYTLGKNFDICKENAIIAARMVNMIMNGCIEPKAEGAKRSKTELCFNKRPTNGFEAELYDIMLKAAGSDGVLQRKEMQKYCEKHPEKLRNMIDSALMVGGETISYPEYRKCDFKQLNLDCLTKRGKEKLAEIIGYKSYLGEFSLIAERELSETDVWQEMLVYATLFGIADRVAEQLKKLYPQYIGEIENYEFNSVFAYGYCMHMYNAMTVAENNGKGGSASFGGGGGFSGGGFGGGTR